MGREPPAMNGNRLPTLIAATMCGFLVHSADCAKASRLFALRDVIHELFNSSYVGRLVHAASGVDRLDGDDGHRAAALLLQVCE